MPVALITGASAGLGTEYARQLARAGYDVVLVARDAERLQTLAEQLSEQYAVHAEALPADLSTDEGLAQVVKRAADVDFLVNNAGFGLRSSFLKSDPLDEDRMLDVMVRALMQLTKAATAGMLERRRGDIINVGSVAAFVPSASGATYAAAKAYVLSLTESLAGAVKGTGVHLSVVCPGWVHTEFHDRLGADTSWIPDWAWLDAAYVVTQSLKDHRAGKVRSVPSLKFKAATTVAQLLPGRVLRTITARRPAVSDGR